MQKTKLHIISFDVPYPPDYGGVIDVFYKIKSLAEAGCEIYLHSFEYGRAHADELKKYCKEVWYYPRTSAWKGISARDPYIVRSRKNNLLELRLIEVDAPILFEGVQGSTYLSSPALKERFKIIRNHNIEHDYYLQLFKSEKSWRKKLIFRVESYLLKKYELSLQQAQAFLEISLEDYKFFQERYPQAIHQFIPGFHPFENVETETGKGDFCLYHGNLSHAENINAALFLLQEVIPFLDVKFIIAGKQPSQKIIDACNKVTNCELIANPSEEKIQELTKQAQIHVLPTFQTSGMKLKLLYALFNGRFVLANDAMLHGTGLDALTIKSNDAKAIIENIKSYFQKPFTEEDKQTRASFLEKNFSNKLNAEKITTLLR